MNYKLFSLLIFSVFLISAASAMTVYADFSDYSQSMSVNAGESVSFNVDFFSMNPPMNIQAGVYDTNGNLIHSFLSMNSNDKTYSNIYTYTPSSVGTYKIIVKGSDGTNSDSETLTLSVSSCPIPPENHAPKITSTPITSVDEGQAYSYHVTAIDEDGDYLTYSLISAPSWLSINSATGIISGTAPLVSSDTNYNIQVKVSDGKSFDTQSYVLKVRNIENPSENHAPVLSPISNQQIDEGDSYSYQTHATDADGDYLTYTISGAPSGFTINSNGLITGTAPYVDSDKTYNIQVKVSDGKTYDTESYVLKVINQQNPEENPEIYIVSPKNQEYDTNHINLEVTTNDIVKGVVFKLDNLGDYKEMDNEGYNDFTYSSLHINDGDHFITFYPTDEDGDIIGTGKTVHFSINTNNENDEEVTGTNAVRIIDDAYYQNKYLNQFGTANVISATQETTSQASGFSIVSLLVYIILGILAVGIILTFYFLFTYMRR